MQIFLLVNSLIKTYLIGMIALPSAVENYMFFFV